VSAIWRVDCIGKQAKNQESTKLGEKHLGEKKKRKKRKERARKKKQPNSLPFLRDPRSIG